MEESPLLSSSSSPSASSIPTDELFERLQREAKTAIDKEPELSSLLRRTVLDDGVKSFEDAVAVTVCLGTSIVTSGAHTCHLASPLLVLLHPGGPIRF